MHYVATLSTLPTYIKEELFRLYHESYSASGERLWYGDSKALMAAYPCGVAYVCDGAQDIRCAVLFQTRTVRDGHHTIKLSLIFHNGSRLAKDHLFSELLPNPALPLCIVHGLWMTAAPSGCLHRGFGSRFLAASQAQRSGNRHGVRNHANACDRTPTRENHPEPGPPPRPQGIAAISPSVLVKG